MARSVRYNVKRKPWGQGRAAQQRHQRNRTAFDVAELIKDRMDLDQAQASGQLFPRGTLKRPANKKLFDWVHRYSGRVWTKQLLKQVVRVLLRTIQNLPMDPSKTYGQFVSQQSKRLGFLIRQAKRIKVPGFESMVDPTYFTKVLSWLNVLEHVHATQSWLKPPSPRTPEGVGTRGLSGTNLMGMFIAELNFTLPVTAIPHLLPFSCISQDCGMDQLETQPWVRDPTQASDTHHITALQVKTNQTCTRDYVLMLSIHFS